MNVIALVDDIEVRIGCLQATMIFTHAHAGRRHAVAGKGAAIRPLTHMKAVCDPADIAVVSGAAVGRGNPLARQSTRGEMDPQGVPADLPAKN